MTLAIAALVAPGVYTTSEKDPWKSVREIVSSSDAPWSANLSRGFVFTAGDATGRKFAYERGGVRASSQLLLASASKFPAAIAIAGAVADGHLTFDTRASQIFDWWSSDSADPRAAVTLRQLLSFTSGFYWPDASSGDAPCLASLAGAVEYTPEACARQIYERAPFKFAPGSTFAYNSFHLQIAGAMAARAAGLGPSLQPLLRKYLIDKLGLKHTRWLTGRNPQLAAGLTSTADDYDEILRAYLAYELVPKAVADEMERDYLAPPYASAVCDWCATLTDYFGHYSMANWYECLQAWDGDADPAPRTGAGAPGLRATPNASWSSACAARRIHMDLGLFGWYPLLDRKKGMYMQIAQQVIVGLNDTNPGCAGAALLRLQVKPAVDRALGHIDDDAATHAHAHAEADAAPAPTPLLGYQNTPASLWSELAAALAAEVRDDGDARAAAAPVVEEPARAGK